MTALLLLALAQDVDELARRLGRDDIAEREEAVRQLVEIGEPVRAKMEALLGASDLEVAGRARTVLDALDERRILRAAFGEKREYAISARDEPVVDVLRKFREQAKFPLVLRDVPLDARVTVEARAATPLEVVDRVCAASGKVRLRPATLTVCGGPAREYPRTFRDQWAVYLDSISVTNAIGGDASYSYASAEFVGAWDTPRAPSAVRVTFSEVLTDAGDNMAVTEDPDEWGWNARPDDAARAWTLSESFNVPDLNVKSLTLRGTVHFDYDIVEGVIAVENPRSGPETKRQTELGEFYLSEFSCLDGTARAGVHFTSPAGAVTPAITRRRGITMRLVDDDGKAHYGTINSSSSGGGGGSETWGYGADFDLPAGKKAVKLEILFPKKSHTIDVPFEFKDIPIR